MLDQGIKAPVEGLSRACSARSNSSARSVTTPSIRMAISWSTLADVESRSIRPFPARVPSSSVGVPGRDRADPLRRLSYDRPLEFTSLVLALLHGGHPAKEGRDAGGGEGSSSFDFRHL